MNIFIIILLGLIVATSSCNPVYHSFAQFSISKDAQTWKTDSCGIGNYRNKISLNILKNKKIFIGIDSNNLKNIIGKPEFIVNHSMLLYPNALFYEYSLSSLENINGKCGDPISKSLSFVIDTNTNKVIGVEVIIY